MRPLQRFENFELIISVAAAAAGTINFGDIPTLRSDAEKDTIIKGIRVYAGDYAPITRSGGNSATMAQMQGMYFSMYDGHDFVINSMPVLELNNTFEKGSATQAYWKEREQEFDNLQIDWTKTKLDFVPFVIGAQISVQFGVSYQWLAPGTVKKIRERKQAAANEGLYN